jgi:hypothetical protein
MSESPIRGSPRRAGDTRIVTIPLNDIQLLERPRDSVLNGVVIGTAVGAGIIRTMFVHAVAVDRNEMDEWAAVYAGAAVVYMGLGAVVGWPLMPRTRNLASHSTGQLPRHGS